MAIPLEDNYEEIVATDEILDAGVRTTEYEGHRVDADLPLIGRRQRVRKLRNTRDISRGDVRPFAVSLTGRFLGGAW